MARKAFTVEEANALIPVMEQTLDRLRACMVAIEETHERLQILDLLWGDRVRDPVNPDHSEFDRCNNDLKAAASQLESIVEAEIVGRGVRFPSGGLENGLLDFPTTWQGRWVYLCWRRGERRVIAWHEIRGGFAGRMPLTADHAQRMGRDDDPAHVDDSMLDH